MRRFDSPWDRSLKFTTAVGVVVLGGAAIAPWAIWHLSPDPLGAALLLPASPLVGSVLLLAFAFSPRAFAIEGRELRVQRRWWRPVGIPLAEVRRVQLLPDRLGNAWRVGGSSGLFGHFGRFRSRALGSFRMYATRAGGLVLVDTDRERYVLSPAPAEAFLETLLSRAPQAVRSAEPGIPPGPARSRSLWWLAISVGVLLLSVGGVAGMSYAYAPVSIGVRGDAIRVERRWAGPVEISIAEVREVGPLPAAARRGWRRTAGVAGLGEAAYGRWHAPALGVFQLYAVRRAPLVLVRTDERTVVLTPDDPGPFIEEIRARMRR